MFILSNGCELLIAGDPTGVVQGCGAASTAAANISRAFNQQMHFIRSGGFKCALPTLSLGCAVTYCLVIRVNVTRSSIILPTNSQPQSMVLSMQWSAVRIARIGYGMCAGKVVQLLLA